MLETFSKRLRFCRAITDLSMNNAIDYIKINGGKISVSGYAYWERTKEGTFPSKSSGEIELLCSLFNERGLNVTSEWLLYGQGQPPEIPWPGLVDDAELFNHCSGILKSNKKWEAIQVAGSYGEPIILIGETVLVSEVTETITPLHGKLGLVIDTNSFRYAGVIEVVNEFTIKVINNNQKFFKIDEISKVYKIHWVRKT